MNAATLQAKINAGYAKAAQRIGYLTNQYRPVSAISNPIASGNLVQSLNVSFNAQDMAYSKPSGYGKNTWYCVADRSQFQTGDYLVNAQDGTFFVVGLQTLLPTLVVQCNRNVSIYRPSQQNGVGDIGYGAETPENLTQIVSGFPVSILQGSKGDKSLVNLPGDVRSPWWVVLIPTLPGSVYLRSNDVVIDDLGKRYKLSSCEQTDLGWRISATECET
jgi:hypothetical protein